MENDQHFHETSTPSVCDPGVIVEKSHAPARLQVLHLRLRYGLTEAQAQTLAGMIWGAT